MLDSFLVVDRALTVGSVVGWDGHSGSASASRSISANRLEWVNTLMALCTVSATDSGSADSVNAAVAGAIAVRFDCILTVLKSWSLDGDRCVAPRVTTQLAMDTEWSWHIQV